MVSIVDYLVALGAWLKTTPLPEFSVWLSRTKLCDSIDRVFWAIPTIQTIHIMAVAMTFTAALMILLRIFQLAGRTRNMGQTANRYLPWIWWGLAVLLGTGFVLCIAEPTRELMNPVFWTKMVLVLGATLITLAFQSSVRRHAERWDVTPNGAVAIRISALAVISLWILIMVAGRWIAYAPG